MIKLYLNQFYITEGDYAVTGAFLIPYMLMAVFCALPLIVLEQAIGQYVGLGALPFWNICPLFRGG